MRRRRQPIDITGAEIFDVGSWNGYRFSDDDLDEIVSSFDFLKLAGRVPLKLGHNDEQEVTDGQPALGWVERVYRSGSKLLADFADVPKVVYDAIRRGNYKFISIELLGNVQAGTRLIPWVLDAVALLGADLPAVGTLKDLQSLVMHKLHGLCGERSLAFKRESTNFGGREAMADENDDVKKLKEELEKLRLSKEAAEKEAKELKFKAKELEIDASEAVSYKRRLEELMQKNHGEKVQSHRKVVKEMFERAVGDKAITAAARERFYKHFDVDSDDVLKLSVKDVEEYIKENPNPFAQKRQGSMDGNGDVISGGFADQELLAKSRKFCRDNNLDPRNRDNLMRGAKDVLRGDRDLGQRYKMLPDDFASGNLSA